MEQSAYDAAFDAATEETLKDLAEHGARRAQAIAQIVERHGVDADDWIDQAQRAGAIQQLDDEDPEGPDAVWALSPEHQIKLARRYYRGQA